MKTMTMFVETNPRDLDGTPLRGAPETSLWKTLRWQPSASSPLACDGATRPCSWTNRRELPPDASHSKTFLPPRDEDLACRGVPLLPNPQTKTMETNCHRPPFAGSPSRIFHPNTFKDESVGIRDFPV